MSPKSLRKDAPQGSREVREFYEEVGWNRQGSEAPVDRRMFGSRTDEGLQAAAYQRRAANVHRLFEQCARNGTLLECGGGGSPAVFLSDLFQRTVLLDFSKAGLKAGRKAFSGQTIDVVPVQGDMCRLPFPDNYFAAAFSAHAIFHIPDASGQRKAFDEILRVVEPNGHVAFVLANPRPLGFPLRLVKRLIADTPILSDIAHRVRTPPPLPYKPMTLSWTRRCLERHGRVEIVGHSIVSTWFQQKVPERNAGRLLWRLMLWIERSFPRLSAYLGCYVLIHVQKDRGLE